MPGSGPVRARCCAGPAPGGISCSGIPRHTNCRRCIGSSTISGPRPRGSEMPAFEGRETREKYDAWAPEYPAEAHNPLMHAEEEAVIARLQGPPQGRTGLLEK